MPASKPKYSLEGESQLLAEILDPAVVDDPREFVLMAYPWGQPNTPLEGISGPRDWQMDVLKDIADYIKAARNTLTTTGQVPKMFKEAVASGRGIGKSAAFSWLAHWLASTRLGGSVWVTANGEPQLRTKTFPEIAKWVAMSINAHWFDISAMRIAPAAWLAEAVERDLKINPAYWYIQGQLWSEENPDAFAGAHNTRGEMYLFDEASGIPDPIWTVAQGVFTEQIIDRFWLAFSNPRRNDGAFHGCFHGADREDWLRRQIDARTTKGVPKDAFESILKKHGPDSDEARVEVYGQFPNQADNQFIPFDTARGAQEREVYHDPGAPLILGVDVARGGKDFNVIAVRKGRDARSIPWERFKGDTVACASRVAEMASRLRADAIFVDGGGVGGGVVDQLKAWGYKVNEVQLGSSARDGDRYKNKRAEVWGLMKEWLLTGSIPINTEMLSDLTNIQYSYHPTSGQIVLESKEDMREKRRLASPDQGDALAMTFAAPVARNDSRMSRTFSRRQTVADDVDYRIFG